MNRKPKNHFKIATLNVRGLKTQIRRNFIQKFINDNKINILALQEINIPTLDLINKNLKVLINYNPDGLGTALIYDDWLDLKEHTFSEDGRVIRAVFNSFTIVNVYGYQEGAPAETRNGFFKEILPNFLKPFKENLILLGDFNTTISKDDRLGPSKISAPLKYLINNLQLKDCFREKNPESKECTFRSRTGGSRIDRIYVENTLIKELKEIRHEFYALSDHLSVIASFNLLGTRPVKPKRSRWILSNEDLERPEIKKIIDLTLKENQNRLEQNPYEWDAVKETIQHLVKKVKKNEFYETKNLKNFLKNAASDILKELNEGNGNFKEYLRLKSLIISLELKELSRIGKVRLKNKIPKEVQSCAHLIAEKRNGESSILHQIKDGYGIIHRGEDNILKIVKNQLQDIYNYEPKDKEKMDAFLNKLCLKKMPKEIADQMISPLSETEFNIALNQLGKEKSPGKDGLPTEFYQTFTEILRKPLLKLFNSIITGKNPPNSFKEGLTKLLSKGGAKDDLKNWRPIALLNSDYKLFTKLITNRLLDSLDSFIDPNQTGGIRGKDIATNLTRVRNTILASENLKKSAIIALDFEKAYDRLDRPFLYKTMTAHGFNPIFINLIQNLYENNRSEVIINGKKSDPIALQRGVRQGCPLALYLYVIYINPFLKSLNDNLKGINFKNITFKLSAFVDDIILFTENDDDINQMRKEIKNFEILTNSKINLAKTQTLGLGDWKNRVDWLNPNPNPKPTGEIEILGVKWSQNLENTINSNSMYYYRKVEGALEAARARSLTILQKVQLINMYILPKLTYISRILSLNKNSFKKIKSKIHAFIWRHNIDKLRWTEMLNPIKEGGMGAIDAETKCKALLIKTTLKYLFGEEKETETMILEYFIGMSLPKFTKPRPGSHAEKPPLFFAPVIRDFKKILKEKSDFDPSKTSSKQIYLILIKEKITRPKILKLNHNNQLFYECFKALNTKALTPSTKEFNFMRIHNITPTRYSLHKCQQCPDNKCKWCDEIEDAIHVIKCPASTPSVNWLLAQIRKMSPLLKLTIEDIHFLNLPNKNNNFIALTAEWHKALFRTRKIGAENILENMIQRMEKNRKSWDPG